MSDWYDLGTRDRAKEHDFNLNAASDLNLPEEDKVTVTMLIDNKNARDKYLGEPYTVDDMTSALKSRGYEWLDNVGDDAKADFLNYLNNTFVNDMLDSWNNKKSFPWGSVKSIDDMNRDAMLNAWADAVTFNHDGQSVENIDKELSDNDNYFDDAVAKEIEDITAKQLPISSALDNLSRSNYAKATGNVSNAVTDKEAALLSHVNDNSPATNESFKRIAGILSGRFF